ncbi:sulfopropanediol 3-dehydrogenase [Cribrihabitans marinus]|uniref:Histidinol dehydrogenase homolog n=1 Tax=Cribrihabitans marinus TaxID=1227549 RepID=A0A1H6SVB9_9RHOB|nr:histidinol dehydrogenase [Cribrihabitans marinus]GGH22779.1 histidinol dehydrogenase [Cribrihabitans marinus]SEI71863.1 sulfopropanediol 3-dehydrogenase [Cribrihabitans marinus]
MPVEYLKTAPGLPPEPQGDTADIVQLMLARLRLEGEAAARDYATRLDGWTGEIVVPPEVVALAAAQVPEDLRAQIDYAHDNIRRFAEAQRASAQDFELELRPGLVTGQRQIPLGCAGCYVPGGRYAHIASALMTITTARAAGVPNVIACSPPRPGQGIHPAILYAMSLAGADRVLALGGVQGMAAMAQGLFGGPPADILVGPGNQFVAEAKRQLFGPVGIDMVAGPTDSMVVADATADPETLAWDLVGQAEHGYNSPVWMITDSRALAQAVMDRIPGCIEQLPEPNRASAHAAWDGLGEVMLAADREEMAATADAYAPEHLHVQAADLAWWRNRLTAYGSLFLGAETTVAFGDKAAGPNHVLPTSGAARYTGGLSAHKFLKTVTWQRAAPQAVPDLARATAAISRAEGMEGHARTADIRLAKAAPAVKLAIEGQG